MSRLTLFSADDAQSHDKRRVTEKRWVSKTPRLSVTRAGFVCCGGTANILPLDRDLELAVIDKADVHALVFPCRRLWCPAASDSCSHQGVARETVITAHTIAVTSASKSIVIMKSLPFRTGEKTRVAR